ncbi:hypothetical protein Golob_008492 [Gossypium lobatum]|uniref:Uncharacterized protein n=1 Tax=Gossypium lobatum TaxID=34289 RepID=A0A7J8MFM1_9ROSI|nr:hypothetical protein [Gossypium lobatum]
MSSHNNNSTSANDPRQPSAAKPYVAQPVSPQDLPVDYSGFIAVIFGIAGVMFRVLPLPLDLSSVLEFDLSLQAELVASDHILRPITGEHEER